MYKIWPMFKIHTHTHRHPVVNNPQSGMISTNNGDTAIIQQFFENYIRSQ